MTTRPSQDRALLPRIAGFLLAALLLATGCPDAAGKSGGAGDTGSRGGIGSHLEELCVLAEEMGKAGSFDRGESVELSSSPGPAEEAIQANWRRLSARFQEESRPARLLEVMTQYDVALGMVEPRALGFVLEDLARFEGAEDFACPAFSYLYLPEVLGAPAGFGHDLLWICLEARTLEESTSAEAAGATLLQRLEAKAQSRWHTSAAGEIIAQAAEIEAEKRVALVQGAAEAAGLELSPQWCGHLFWAWGGKPLLHSRIEGLCALTEKMAKSGAFDRDLSLESGPLMDRLQLTNTIAKNWSELTFRFGEEHALSRSNVRDMLTRHGFQEAEGLHPADVDLALERAAGRALESPDYFCPAFSYLYLPEWAGAADGPGRDLFWICYAGRDLEAIDADFGGRVLLERLTNDPPTRWRAPETLRLIEEAAAIDRAARFELFAGLAKRSGVALPEGWCAGAARAWGPSAPGAAGELDYAKMLQDVPAQRFPRQEMMVETGPRRRLELVSVTTSPSENRPAVERHLRHRANELRFCVERFSPEGESRPITMTTSFTLGDDGSVSEVGRITMAGGPEQIATCASTRLGRWRLSGVEGTRTVVATWRYEVDPHHSVDVNHPQEHR